MKRQSDNEDMNDLLSREFFEKQMLDELTELYEKKFKNKKFKNLIESIKDTENKDRNYPTRPRTPNLNKISSVTETAFQRAVFNGNKSVLCFNDSTRMEIRWLDLELPVTLSSKSRRKCIDLIGCYDQNPILCELKYKNKSDGDRPEYAVFELLSYLNFVKWNCEKLDKKEVHHQSMKGFSWKDIANHSKPTLIVAANDRYWNDWFRKNTHKCCFKNNLLDRVNDLNRMLNVNICLFSAKNEDFLSQKEKGDSGKYTPKVTSKIWYQIN